MYILKILIIFFKHSVSLTTTLRYFHETLSESGVDELLHLLIALVNFSFKKESYINNSFNGSLSKILMLIW